MIAAARERYPACTFAVSPCTPLGFENESMDVITVSCAFHHFETPQAFANECMRILKKSGKVFIAEPFFSPVVRWIANTVVFPLSRTGDVRVYNQKELQLFLNWLDLLILNPTQEAPCYFFLQGRERHLVGQKNENRRGSKMKMPEKIEPVMFAPVG